MGTYTEFCLTARLKRDTPAAVINTLQAMVDDPREALVADPAHRLFHAEDWSWTLRSASAYHETAPPRLVAGDDGRLLLTVKSSLKNYDDQIARFCDWIAPWIDEPAGMEIGSKQVDPYGHKTLLVFQGDSIGQLVRED